MDSPEKQPPVEKIFLVNIWEGNFGLATMYWVYGVLGGVVWVVGIVALDRPQESDTYKSMIFLLLLYYLCVYVGIWQAAPKYAGNKVWAVLAKFAVVVTVLPILIKFVKWAGILGADQG